MPRDETFKNIVSTYTGDFGVCRVVLSRYVPADMVLFLGFVADQRVAAGGAELSVQAAGVDGGLRSGEVLGEYTVEVRNEKGHCVLSGLDV